MTDRHYAYIVTLERDTRDDDAEATIMALRQIKGVMGVEPLIASPEFHAAESRARHEITMKLYELARSFAGLT